ncbi:MAG: hypothetical protein IGR80_13310 [Synechococcales cyanobacterium K44_A2020_017]|jgi:hypothetical protein|nr:hypothetical protein [Synechococcales cyanobacterium K32_A2020_035]MBF2095721.1 hypothetical protein [Synechococcales cyanobacterium K44_A2020_017]
MGLPGMDDWFYCAGQLAAIAHLKASVNLCPAVSFCCAVNPCRAGALLADRFPHMHLIGIEG